MSNYETKSDLKEKGGINTTKFAKTTDLTNLKSGIEKLYIDKLKAAPVDLSKLSNVLRNDIVKKTG